MTTCTRRHTLRLLTSATLAAVVAPHLLAQEATEPTDWSQAIVDSTMARLPDPTKLGGWGYQTALFLYGVYLLYKRNHDKRLLTYIQGWVDLHVDADGNIDRKITALDYMLPGKLLLVLHKETAETKYKKAADIIRHTFDTYPRTEDGGLWHAFSRQHQLWLDGMYMSMPFLTGYGVAYNDSTYAFDEATKQLLLYAKHLNDPGTGLLFHAYDESGAQKWADPVTHHSGIFWCRAIGWYGMALIEVLDIMPHNHSHRKDLIALVQQLAKAYARFQDHATGLWYQVLDKGSDPRNWLETSSSCMYTYTLSKAIDRGYIPKHFRTVMCKGYKGVLSQLSIDADGHAHIANICEGTNVADLDYYFNRARKSDDFHGLGAFLIMNEQLRTQRC